MAKKKNKKEIRKFTFSYKGKLPISNFHERHSYYYQNNVSGKLLFSAMI